jgi:pyridoxal phosphate enzyme (YggS family)
LLCWMLFEKNKKGLLQEAPIFDQVRQACQLVGRSPVQVLVVSKNQGIEAIIPLLKEGHRWFGENRLQEAIVKWPVLRHQFPGICLHLIGPLQTNKVKKAVSLFNVIESVDRSPLALAIAKEWQENLENRALRKILIQVNTGREPQKSGVLVENLKDLINLCQDQGLPLTGLMGIPPVHEDSASHFHLLAELAHKYSLPDLSMGMSGDFPAAIACGATWVRLGTAVFKK